MFVIGADRTGILAAVTAALRDLDCNLEDCVSNILRGHFAVTLVVAAPEGVTDADLRTALAPAERDLGVNTSVKQLEPEIVLSEPDRVCRVTVNGRDRRGIVAAIAAYLAEREFNVMSMRSVAVPSVTLGEGFGMLLEVDIPTNTDLDELRFDLERIGLEIDVVCDVLMVDDDASDVR